MKAWNVPREVRFGACMFVIVLLISLIGAVALSAVTHDDQPGPEWVHDRGSIYWTCTSDGHALIKDTDTGSTMLARDDRKCDSGG
ncbi:hypothetical protein [uncultured Dermacoccus sp.]|uniref:hypothetical protein n=2 Tax=Micrococcales TaxID=85006 RepID=UPI00259A741A|nr:hypothetical protein [uncultured Dermacoccus sp.]